jgi:spore germination protein (amino acid permease)
MSIKVKERYLVSAFFTFFLVHGSQTGVGVLKFQKIISKDAQQDAWISLLISGVLIHVVIWMIYKILDDKHNELTVVHQYFFGKIIGNVLNLVVLVYFFLSSLTVFRTYIEVIQVWVYPTLKTWQLSILLSLIIYYIVSGGFRVLTGFSFWGVVLPSFLFLLIYFPLQHAKWEYLLPIFNHSSKEILYSMKASTILFLGFEWILLYYPFIKDVKKSQKWAHYGNMYTILLYLIVTIISFVYFNQQVLQHLPWATLMMVKIVMLPFIERFEYFFIFIWLLVIIPPVCLSIWACTRILKNISTIPPIRSLVFFLIIMSSSSILIKDWITVNKLAFITSEVGFYFIFGYIPLLFFIKIIKQKWSKYKQA